ncbi:MAG: tRNA (adenosine(37)-N6)-threonylcarbamoyltransferase complex dimerization subunit type 1 TsaB [Eubacteriales bacterium]
MKILALDSTAKAASAALCEDGRVLASFVCDNGLTHSEKLLPMAEAVLQSLSLTVADVDLFAVTAGPGSFTGVRIAAAIVKGLAFGRGKPCVGVSTLEALAENLVPLEGLYCPVMDARRNQLYNALFTFRDGALVRLTPDRAISPEALCGELVAYTGMNLYLCGDGDNLARDCLRRASLPPAQTPLPLRLQSAAAVARCAYRAFLRGEAVSEQDLLPTYLRAPQAERERAEQEKAAPNG